MNDAIVLDTGFTARLDKAIDEAIAKHRIVGTVILAARDGEPVYQRAAGVSDREASTPMRIDTIFRLASVTKPMVAATALALSERGVLSLDAPVTRWLADFRPKLRDGRAPEITVQQLLTHTAGIGYATMAPGDPYRAAGISGGIERLSMDAMMTFLGSLPLYHEPGTAWRYGMNIDVLGAVIEKATGGRLGEAVATFVTKPLDMTDTGFSVTDRTRLAAAYADGVPPVPMTDPHEITDELGEGTRFSSSRIFDQASFQSGGSGMAGTAPDFLRFLEAIRKGGAPILKPETVALASRNHISDFPREEKDAGWRFGLLSAVLADPVAAKTRQSVGTLQWGGIYGHSWFIDPTAGLSVAAFTNTSIEGCLGSYPKEIVAAVYG